MFIDSNHVGDKQIRRARTRFMMYMNMSLINWSSKKQSTIETSVFCAEFVAMKVRVVTLHATLHKLRMMGIPISGPAYIYGDDMSVIHNTLKPESTIEKKCDAIAYHANHELTMRESLTGYTRSEDNPPDMLSKVVIGQKKKHLVSKVLYDIHDEDM